MRVGSATIEPPWRLATTLLTLLHYLVITHYSSKIQNCKNNDYADDASSSSNGDNGVNNRAAASMSWKW